MSGPTLDGYTVELGDKVFDNLFGAGVVTEITQVNSGPAFRVVFPGYGNGIVYTSDGRTRRYKRRTLYWKDPVIVLPIKDETNWDALKNMARDFTSSFRKNVDRGA